MIATDIIFRNDLNNQFADIYTPEVVSVLHALLPLNQLIKEVMWKRDQRRKLRFENKEPITFLDPEFIIPGVNLRVRDIRKGNFRGDVIPADLQRQWIQGTGPAARPNSSITTNLRNVAYALLSGADGWMFDCEDALGQIGSMSLDHQRSLRLAISRDPLFLETAEQIAAEMNAWSVGFFGRNIVSDWMKQLDFTTIICRARGLHLDDRHVRTKDGVAIAASLVDAILYIVNNYKELKKQGRSLVLYLPKIQTAEEAAVWNEILGQIEGQLGLPDGSIKTYVLVEQLEATYQLLEIRAALGRHFVGFNTGRWDYINSVADAMAWDPGFINPNIEEIGMTYGYMKHYEHRVRQVVNMPDLEGNFALWQGGMEPNIPVGSKPGVEASMKKAVAGAFREEEAGASGKWVAHWKMVHIVRPVWEKKGRINQMGRTFSEPRYDPAASQNLTLLEPAERSIRGARNLISVALQYGNAFGQGFQAAALKAADYFGNDDVLYLMEDMATGEIRVSILWEWVNKKATLTEPDVDLNVEKGSVFSEDIFRRLLREEYDKLLQADNRDVHDDSKKTTLPIALAIVENFVLSPIKFPWYIDLLNINLNNLDLQEARDRIQLYTRSFMEDGIRITKKSRLPDVKRL